MLRRSFNAVSTPFTLGIFVAVLEIAMRIFKPSPAIFARPSEIIGTLPQFFDPAAHGIDTFATLERAFVALLIGSFIGLALGILVSKAKKLKGAGVFLVDFLRSTPATALVPLFLIIFGLGSSAKIAAGAFSGSLSVALAVIVGYANLNAERARLANAIALRGWQRIFRYELMEILPSLFIGFRTAASLSLILVIVAEMLIGSDNGLGKIIMDARYSDAVPLLYAGIVMCGFVGYFLNTIFQFFERLVTARLGVSK